MYWILTRIQLTALQIEEALGCLFSELHFHYLDDSKLNWFENRYFHCRDNKNFTFSINNFTDTLRSKIEFHDLDAKTAVKMTQYIGKYLSKTYKTIVVTEIEGEDSYIACRSLMIDGERLVVINDDGIEFNEFEIKELRNYEGYVHCFDEQGSL